MEGPHARGSRSSTRASKRATRWCGSVAGAVAIELDPDDRDGDGLRFVEGPHEDLYGHGTACAGIVRSLAPDAELYSVRVLGAELTGRASVFAAGLRWAIEHDMDVVNLSLSTSRASGTARSTSSSTSPTSAAASSCPR